MRTCITRTYLILVRAFFHILSYRPLRDLILWPLTTRILGKDYTEPYVLKAGFSMHAYLDDQLGRFALMYGTTHRYFWEPSTMYVLEKIVRDAHHVVIAGSHIGLTALYARQAMKHSDAHVHTFEPIQELYTIAERNFSRNPELSQISITRAALGDRPGTVTMTQDRVRSRIIETSAAQALPHEEVPITTIDTYVTQKNIPSLDLVFLDVEGYELNALRGMESLLSTRPPIHIIYEISFPRKDNCATAHAIEAYLAQFGYTCYIIEEAHDMTDLQVTDPSLMLTQTSPSVYEAHRAHRYFNVFATLKTPMQISHLITQKLS